MLLDVRTYRCKPGTLAAHLALYEAEGKAPQFRCLGEPLCYLKTETGDPKDADNQNTWCNMTQHILGPDNENVDRIHCVEGRKCYECIG